MKATELPYDQFEEGRIPLFELIRDFRTWRAFSAGVFDHLIVIDDFSCRRAFVFKYVNNADRKADAELLRRLSDDGEETSRVPAWLIPIPPTRSASAANPLPEDSAA